MYCFLLPKLKVYSILKKTLYTEFENFKFESVYMDGEQVNPDYYTAKSGSTIIELKETYMNHLKPGKHHVRIKFIDGVALTDITIKDRSIETISGETTLDETTSENLAITDETMPKKSEQTVEETTSKQKETTIQEKSKDTGDTAHTGIWIMILCCGAAGVMIGKKSKRCFDGR